MNGTREDRWEAAGRNRQAIARREKGPNVSETGHDDERRGRASSHRQRAARAGIILLALACAVCCTTGLLLLAEGAYEDQRYLLLSQTIAVTDDAGGERDWDALLARNPELVAWLTVEGTAIDLPVVQPGEDTDADFYLDHDFWGGCSATGCPYLDARADADGAHLLVYGHHIGLTRQMFSELFQVYEQDGFNGIGAAVWSTPDGDVTAFTPVFAMSVDKGYEAIQTFSFEDDDELHAWLLALGEDATARAEDWEGLCMDADRVLTLVTCSNVVGGRRERTLVVFVAT